MSSRDSDSGMIIMGVGTEMGSMELRSEICWEIDWGGVWAEVCDMGEFDMDVGGCPCWADVVGFMGMDVGTEMGVLVRLLRLGTWTGGTIEEDMMDMLDIIISVVGGPCKSTGACREFATF
jgi:hypothetical protein